MPWLVVHVEKSNVLEQNIVVNKPFTAAAGAFFPKPLRTDHNIHNYINNNDDDKIG